MVGSDITTISTFTQPGHSDLIQKEETPRGTAAAGAELLARARPLGDRDRLHGAPDIRWRSRTAAVHSRGALPRARRLDTEEQP